MVVVPIISYEKTLVSRPLLASNQLSLVPVSRPDKAQTTRRHPSLELSKYLSGGPNLHLGIGIQSN